MSGNDKILLRLLFGSILFLTLGFSLLYEQQSLFQMLFNIAVFFDIPGYIDKKDIETAPLGCSQYPFVKSVALPDSPLEEIPLYSSLEVPFGNRNNNGIGPFLSACRSDFFIHHLKRVVEKGLPILHQGLYFPE